MRQELIWRGMQVIEEMERETGLEPATSSLGSWHSTTELLPLALFSVSYEQPLTRHALARFPESPLFRPNLYIP